MVLGLFPAQVIALLDPVNELLVGSTVGREAARNWLLLAPINADRASYSPLIVLGVIAAIVLATTLVVRRFYHGRVRRADAWDCGFPLQTPRMQDTAEGFGQPIRQVFEPFFRLDRHLPSPFDTAPRYHARADDPWWHWLYRPIARVADLGARLAGLIQLGRISVYLTYSFVTLLVLLFFVR